MTKIVKKKQSNRSKILTYVCRNAPVSRAAIAEDTDITPATVTTTVAALITEGLIYDLGETEQAPENTLGRKRVLIDLNPDFCHSIGVEFTEKTISFCLTNLRGTIIDQISLKPNLQQVSNITDIIISNLNLLLDNNKDKQPTIIGIGFAVPGHMNEDESKLLANSSCCKSFDLPKIKESFDYPITCENNVRSMAVGEYIFHPARCPENFSLFHIGLGMFCATISNGELFATDNYISGEIGHTIVNLNGRRCDCGKYGCLQTYSSESWLIKTAKFLYESESQTILRTIVKSKEEITISHLTSAYSLGDPIICSYISEALKYLGVTISNLTIIMNPTKILLHGQLFNNEDICNELMDYIERQLLFVEKRYKNEIEILPYSELEGCMGGSAIAISHFYYNA